MKTVSQSQWFPWRKLIPQSGVTITAVPVEKVIPQSGVTVAVVPVEKVDTSKRCHNDSGSGGKVIPQSGVTVTVVPL